MDAHDAGACESRRAHHTGRCRIAGNRRVGPGDGTDEALARGGAQIGIAQARHGRGGRLHGEVLVGVRAKAGTWVDADGRRVDTGLLKRVRLMQQVRLDLTREALGVLARVGSRLACQVALAGVHGHNTATILSGDPHHLGVLEARNVVEDVRACVKRGSRDTWVARVHRDEHAACRKGLDHRDDARDLLVLPHRRKTGAGGLAAHVDEVGTVVEHLVGPGERLGKGVVRTAVAEGVGRHVEHAHDAGASQVKHATATAPLLCQFSHVAALP